MSFGNTVEVDGKAYYKLDEVCETVVREVRESSLPNLIKELQKIEKKYGDKYTSLWFEHRTEEDYGGDETVVYYIQGVRPETDEECTARIRHQLGRAERLKKADEYQEYLRLKAKFEGV